MAKTLSLHPSFIHPEDPGAQWRQAPAPLPSAPAQPGGRRKEGRKRVLTLSGVGTGALLPDPGLLPGGSPDPSLGPSHSLCWECGFQQKSWKKDSPQTPYGGPQLKAKDWAYRMLITPLAWPLY